MHLLVNGAEYAISHLAPDYLIIPAPPTVEPQQAEIRLSIDGSVRQWPVYLPEGIRHDHKRTPIARNSPNDSAIT